MKFDLTDGQYTCVSGMGVSTSCEAYLVFAVRFVMIGDFSVCTVDVIGK